MKNFQKRVVYLIADRSLKQPAVHDHEKHSSAAGGSA